jgi:hypothetical protein
LIVDKIVRPVTRTAIRDNAVAYQAVDLYSTKRQEFQNKDKQHHWQQALQNGAGSATDFNA